MDKVQVERNFFIQMPGVIVVIRAGGKNHFMTVGRCSRANTNAAWPGLSPCRTTSTGLPGNRRVTRGVPEGTWLTSNHE